MSPSHFYRFLAVIGIITFVFTFSASFFNIKAFALELPEEPVNRTNLEQIDEITEDIKQVDPIPVESEPLSLQQGQMVSNQQDLQVKIDLKDKEILVENQDKGSVNIGVPDEDSIKAVDIRDDKVIYTNDNYTQTIVEAVDGGVRQLIRIESASAPKTYDFPVQLEDGDTLQLLDNVSAVEIDRQITDELNIDTERDSQEQSSPQEAVVKDKDGKVKLYIAPPWARDNYAQDLQTWYTVENGNTLRQHVGFDERTAFPVVADPAWCGSLVSNTWWNWHEGNWRLRVNPTWCARHLSGTGGFTYNQFHRVYNYWVARDGFNEIIRKTENHPAWDKRYGTNTYWSMFNQYACHLYNIGVFLFKSNDTWNLEPWRRNVGLERTYFSFCNP